MQKEEDTAGRRVVFIKAWRCGRTWVIWGNGEGMGMAEVLGVWRKQQEI